MLTIVEVVLVAALTTLVLHVRRGRDPGQPPDVPWVLGDIAGHQMAILGGAAGFAVTALVLLITFAGDRAEALSDSFESVVVMILVAWISMIGAAVMFSRMPREEYAGPVPRRIHYALANGQYYRAIVVSWLAMLPLLRTFSLDRAAGIFEIIVAGAGLAGAVLAMVVVSQLGLLNRRDVLLVPLLCVIGGVLATVLDAVAGVRSSDPTLWLALAVMALNGSDFWLTALAPEIIHSERTRAIVLRFGRALIRWDAAATVTLMTFYWFAVTGRI